MTSRVTFHAGVFATIEGFRERFKIQFTKWGDKYIEVNGLQDRFRSQTRGF